MRWNQLSTSTHAIIGASAIFTLTVLVYMPALDAEFIWDDDNYVTANMTLRTSAGLRDIWLKPTALPQYYPLVHTTFWLEYRLWALNPVGYHVTNVVCHAVSAMLLWALLRRLKLPGAWFTALLFACHPVHVESVAWVTERKNVLSGFFCLLSLLCFLPILEPSLDRRHRAGLYAISFVSFLAALCSKTVTCTLPVVILILCWWRSRPIRKNVILPLLPYFLSGFVFGMLTVHLEKHLVGAAGGEWQYTWIERLMIAGRALWFYPWKLVWPAELCFIYPRWSISAGQWHDLLYIGVFLVLLLGLYLYRQRDSRSILAALLVYAVTLFPALGFFDVYPMRYSFVADHFQYLASVPILALVGSLLTTVTAGTGWRYLGPGLVIGVLGGASWSRSHAFLQEDLLWLDTMRKNPAAWIAYNNLGLVYMNRGQLADAMAMFQTSIQVKPNHALAYNNLAMAQERAGEPGRARRSYERSLLLNPTDVRVLNHYGTLLARLEEHDAALEQYQRALAVNPNDVDVRINLGNLYAARGAAEQAAEQFQRALAISPDNADAHHNLGSLLLNQGRVEEALTQFMFALRVRSNVARDYYQAGMALLRLGRDDEAVDQFLCALGVDSNYAMAYFQLGYVFQKRQQIAMAVDCYQKALAVRPEFAEAHNNLGALHELQGQTDKAIQEYREAVRLHPGYVEAQDNLRRVAGTEQLPGD